jgi:hypothetical protein
MLKSTAFTGGEVGPVTISSGTATSLNITRSNPGVQVDLKIGATSTGSLGQRSSYTSAYITLGVSGAGLTGGNSKSIIPADGGAIAASGAIDLGVPTVLWGTGYFNKISVSQVTPATASATGTLGTIAWDASYMYVCIATNTWKRVAIATW